MLTRQVAKTDYLEIGLDAGVCYNPLHNDLDPYAVAYAIATLLNNLFGKSKEPFWQQAYTDLLKFVILLRRITDGYTTLAEVYRYIIEDSQIDHDIRALHTTLAESARRPFWCRPSEYRLALRSCAVAALVPRRPRVHGAPVRCRARNATSCRATCRFASRSPQAAAGRTVATSSKRSSGGTGTAGHASTPDCGRRIIEGVVVFLSLVRREPRRSGGVLPTARARTPGT